MWVIKTAPHLLESTLFESVGWKIINVAENCRLQTVNLTRKALQLCIIRFNYKFYRLVNDVFISEVLSIMTGIKIDKANAYCWKGWVGKYYEL